MCPVSLVETGHFFVQWDCGARHYSSTSVNSVGGTESVESS